MHQYWDITNMSPSYYVDEMLGPRVEVVRRRLAGAFGCDPEEMAITRNTSESMEIVQLGLDLKPGDEVLTTTQDYPRMLTAWRQREARDGIVLKTVSFPTPSDGPEAIVSSLERAITPRTRVILICHVTYTTGQIFPVKAICAMARERGIETLVDGAHGFAHFPFTRDDLDCECERARAVRPRNPARTIATKARINMTISPRPALSHEACQAGYTETAQKSTFLRASRRCDSATGVAGRHRDRRCGFWLALVVEID
jgi:hypothetical protein